MASLLCAVPRTTGSLYSILSSPFFKKPTRKLKPFFSTSIPQPNRKCSNGVAVSIAEEREIARSPQLVASEYAELNLSDKFSEEPAPVPDWCDIYSDSTLPLMVDIGSGSGRFLMWLAKRNLDSMNYLGLEIRQKLVKRANYWANELALNNIHFIFANATVSFKQLVSTYPGPLTLVSILCPDPHFKKKYHKRRVVQQPLVESIVDSLIPGGRVFVQSDVLEVALDMRNKFDTISDELLHVDKINPSLLDNEGWLLSNPMGIRTEREIHAEFEGAKIYRRVYQKRK
ncbi:tRNA (guanine-N-7) methyltransferase [Actinidia rufa]|uniref:tRNA (guanine(46)-N(7))-methyltransferase n=1 Tax=Actinidia rufa TaxID=165716 RepID=A0A7J0EVB7_9ERIC|nr:tRNA (guanine-N-7) methyltransferase [Actinidia rufa]